MIDEYGWGKRQSICWVGNGSKYLLGVFIAVIGLIIDEIFVGDMPHGPNPYNTKH